ncbi:flagellar biosynthetic protein FliO [Sphingosinicella soli]|uniref:Flagellar protein FliO/FliZ n=1 Tax=Sphingosinicella soli TaxID=333708 RepID=A0A7W7F9M9_9SPHN|nr:flagellar biosynthetic protein FliO [Sphingosinicella soli]MBB4632813.1 flagellar protein FliO/FliZ [Sphingosinicella soli]
MIGDYVLRLAIMLPLVCGLIVAGLWLAKRYNLGGLTGGLKSRTAVRSAARLSGTVFLTPAVKLAVVDFEGKRLLLAVTKQGANLLSEVPAISFTLEDDDDAR